MSDLTKLTLKAALDGLKARDFSSEEITRAFLSNIEADNPTLNAFVEITTDKALAMARASDVKLAKGEGGSLEGAPLGIKDNFTTAGVRTTAGSRILSNFIPDYSAAVVERVFDAGAVMLGKTNMDEFGMGSSTENSYWGPTRNPLKPDIAYSPGGSSGGSAAAVAGRLALAALASDTGGSIRQPAAFCGVVGYKPTYGLLSRWGLISYASSLDQAGAIGSTVADTRLLIQTMMATDCRDSTSVDPICLDAAVPLTTSIGVPIELLEMRGSPELAATWRTAMDRCRELGIEVREISLPMLKYALPAYYIIALSEASSNLARYDGLRFGLRSQDATNLAETYELSRAEGFSEETAKRILLGTFTLSAGHYDEYYLRALRVRRLISEELDRAMQRVDLLMWPTTPTPSFPLGSFTDDPLNMYLEDVFTVPVNLAGLPAISLPIHETDGGLPMSIQLIGPRFGDGSVFATAAMFEGARPGP